MSRFIRNGDLLINTDRIALVQQTDNGKMLIEANNGKRMYFPKHMLSEIKQIVPAKNIYAIFKCGNGYHRELVPAMFITTDGKIRPIDFDEKYPDYLDTYENYQGVDFSDMTIEEVKDEEFCERYA